MSEGFKVDIGGKLRVLKFNNFAHIEIANILFKDDPMSSNPDAVVKKLYEIANKNVMLLMKTLIYAGIIGNDYEEGFDSDVTQQEVGKWVSTADIVNLIGAWKVFLDWMGQNIPNDLVEGSGEVETEKKS